MMMMVMVMDLRTINDDDVDDRVAEHDDVEEIPRDGFRYDVREGRPELERRAQHVQEPVFERPVLREGQQGTENRAKTRVTDRDDDR